MIDNVIIENDRIVVVLKDETRLYFSHELAEELKIFLNELL